MASRNKVCYLCGKAYKYCGDCAQDRMKPSWMATFHSESCKTIFQTCTDYNMKKISKAEAKRILKKCDLKNKSSFADYVQRDIKAIFAEEKPVAPATPVLPVEEEK